MYGCNYYSPTIRKKKGDNKMIYISDQYLIEFDKSKQYRSKIKFLNSSNVNLIVGENMGTINRNNK